MNMQVNIFINTLALVLVFTVSAQAQANLEEFRMLEVELLDTASIQDNFEHFDSVQVFKPTHSEPIPCDPETCQHRTPPIFKGSTMRSVRVAVDDAANFVKSLIE